MGAASAAGAFVVGLVVWAWRRRRHGVSALEVARHYDRIYKELEESCTLLLLPDDRLSPAARLQRDRVAVRLAGLPEVPLFPNARLVGAAAFLCLSLLLGAAAARWTPGLVTFSDAGTASSPTSSDTTRTGAIDLPLLERMEIRITPPAYTGLPSRMVAAGDLRVEEGARVVWTAVFSGPVEEARWVFGDGTVLSARPDSGATVRVEETVAARGFYSVEVRARGQTWGSDFYRLDVIPDAAPVIVVDEPVPRLRIEPGRARRVRVRASVEDDYGIASTRLTATLASGTGENVRFREETTPFDRIERVSAREHRLEKTFDLDRLGMEPGDELYFVLHTEDNRRPHPQASRSETFFVLLPDTAAPVRTAEAGYGIDLVPEYFRSQRQIILDVEALIEDDDRGMVEREDFETRSNGIGIDQKLLRLRYGQYLGEEFETGIDAGLEDEAAGGDHEGHEHDESSSGEPPPVGDVTIDALVHMHDSEENATLFAESVRSFLKAALAEMWESELRLRTHRPRRALPHAYRALDLLKETQQRARIYVRRIGFEPPPLRPDEQRLTGEIEDATPPRTTDARTPESSHPEVRAALGVLRTRSAEDALTEADRATLERAGETLAGFAVEAPGAYLDALQALRTLLRDEMPCTSCRLLLERALWRILPPASVRPVPDAGRRTGLGAAYLRRLSED